MGRRARRRRRGGRGHVDGAGSGHRPPARRTRRTTDQRLRGDGALRVVGSVVGLGSQLRRPGRRAGLPVAADSGPGCWTVRCRCGRPCGSPTPPASCRRTLRRTWTGRSPPYAHGCTWAQIDRLVEEALVRYDPEAAEERRREANEHRHVDLGLEPSATTASPTAPPSWTPPTPWTSKNAIARRAKLNGQLGDTDSLDVRRAKALGEIAREDLILDLEVVDPETGEITRTVPGRKTELILHISATDQTVGRFGNTRTPISVEQIKEWLSLPNTSVIVRPVIDLAGDQAVDSYEIPDRIRRQVELTDHHCGYPYCTDPSSPATSTTSSPTPTTAARSDLAHAAGPQCRGHHRMKTAGKAHLPDDQPRHLLLDPPVGHLPGRPHRHLPTHRDTTDPDE